MIRVSLNISGLLPENSHRIMCILTSDEKTKTNNCNVISVFPKELADKLGEDIVLAGLYIAARVIDDSSAWAAYHLYALMKRKEVANILIKEITKNTKVNPPLQPINWTNFWKGRTKALTILLNRTPAIVKIIPPKNKAKREKLRVILEGKRGTIKGKTYHVGGLVKKLGGKRLAPWIYIIPRNQLHKLKSATNKTKLEISFPTLHL